MIATLHASQRLLERVFKMNEYSSNDIYNAKRLLELEFMNVSTSRIETVIAMPSFPSMLAVIKENRIITVKSKERLAGMDEKKRKRLFMRNRNN